MFNKNIEMFKNNKIHNQDLINQLMKQKVLHYIKNNIMEKIISYLQLRHLVQVMFKHGYLNSKNV